jgi:transposase-like protein
VKGYPWSDDEERALIEMRAAGKSFVLIAKALGRSEASCVNRWRKKIKLASGHKDSSGTPPAAAT